jgi:prepilin-type N-terminal cleavage/methylation domain-containing protein
LGFTLIELLVAIGILSILAAIAITQYRDYKFQAYDTTAKSDLKSAFTAIESYFVENQTYPGDYTDLLGNGFNFSKDVCFTKFHTHNSGTQVHIHIMHTASPNAWHNRYPDDAGDVDQRNTESCL